MMWLHEMLSLTSESLSCLGILTVPMIPHPRAAPFVYGLSSFPGTTSSSSVARGQLKRRNLKKFRLERENQVYPFKPEFFSGFLFLTA